MITESSKSSKSLPKSKSKEQSNKSKLEQITLLNRCYQCNKKLKMIYFTCRCNHNFCIKHQYSHSHNCSYNAIKAKKEEIIKNNPKVINKIEKI
jgi:hypothetical protein